METRTHSLGSRFALALAAKDEAALTALLSESVDFKALTPRRAWEADNPASVLTVLLGTWFEPQDEITEVLDLSEGGDVADTQHVSYRFALRTPDGPHVAEQQVYYRSEGEQIGYLRVLCSGFRPVT